MNPEDLIVGEAYFLIRYERTDSPIPVLISYEYVGTQEFLDEDARYCCKYVFNYLPAFRRKFERGEVRKGFADGDIPHALDESALGELRNGREALTELTCALVRGDSNQRVKVCPVDSFTAAEIGFMRRLMASELKHSHERLKNLAPNSPDAVSTSTPAVLLSRILEKMVASEERVE